MVKIFWMLVLPALFDRQRWWLFLRSAARTRRHQEYTKLQHLACSSTSFTLHDCH